MNKFVAPPDVRSAVSPRLAAEAQPKQPALVRMPPRSVVDSPKRCTDRFKTFQPVGAGTMTTIGLRHTLRKNQNTKLSSRDVAYEVIRRSIMLGDAKAGTRINERLLAEKLGISRVPVREALLCLYGEGLLSKSKCGLEVTQLSHEDTSYQIEFRSIIECAAVRLTVGQITSELINRLEDVIVQQTVLVHAENWQAFHESDLMFHQLIRQATGNPFITRLSGTLALGLTLDEVQANMGYRDVIEDHRCILDAIIAGDANQAEQLMLNHVISDSNDAQIPRNAKGNK